VPGPGPRPGGIPGDELLEAAAYRELSGQAAVVRGTQRVRAGGGPCTGEVRVAQHGIGNQGRDEVSKSAHVPRRMLMKC